MYLLDTNVVSESWRPNANLGVREWLEKVDDDHLFLSSLVIGELRLGVERLRRRDPLQAAAYEQRLVAIRDHFDHRVIPVDLTVTDTWARLNVPNPVPVIDGLMAATAQARGWTLVTRNVADIRRTGVAYLNPFR